MPVLAVWVLLLTAAPLTPSALPVSSSVSAAPVVVKIGQASLEEYRHGNPADRTQLIASAQPNGRQGE